MLARNFTCELIGTFALTFIGAGAIVVNAWAGEPGLLGIALAHGLALSIAVTATMNISGGHINPAVTIAMLATGRIKFGPAIAYIIAQCIGATIAGFLLTMIFNAIGPAAMEITGTAAIAATKLGTPAFNPQAVSPGIAVLTEAAMTFLLLFAVFLTAVDPRAPKVGGFGVGLTVGVGILMGGPITGGAMNPARTIGTLIGGGDATSSLWSQHWIYWVGPTVGAVIAALIYEMVIKESKPHKA